MNVVACAGRGRTKLESRPRPQPGPGDLLLELRGCGLCGTDLYKLAAGSVAPGTVLGHELLGVVNQRGDGVHGFEVGDRVVAPHHVACGACPLCQGGSETLCRHFKENLLDPGGFSELVLVKERCVRAAAWKVPVNVCDEAAIWLEPAACVLRGVRRSGLAEGGVALVLGAGSMGLLHVAVLHAVLPDAAVWCVEPLEPRRALALRLGARGAWPPESARDLLREANGGLGADVVFDTVGGVTGLDQALDLCREGGSIVLFAHAGPSERGRLDFNRIFKEERRLIGSYSSALSEQSEVRELLAGGRLDPSCLVTEWLKLSEFDEAVELVKTHQAVKVILGPG